MAGTSVAVSPAPLRLGLRANRRQFALLVLINAFVGGMVGLERTVVPLIGAEEFGIASAAVVTSFIVSFGLVKACANLVSGLMADAWGRKRVLILGWLLGVPVPFLIIFAPSWGWIVAANVLLGLNQGFAWSMTVVMKVDLVGPARRGLALGLNEFAGYCAVGITAFVTGYIASRHGLRPDPFYLGIAYTALGLALSVLLVRDTYAHARFEAANHPVTDGALATDARFRTVFALTTWRNRNLFAISQAGLINNLNDGMSWGIFPLFFLAHGVSLEGIGLIKAVYPVTWGVGQLVTGSLSDRWGRKGLIMGGMWLQASGLVVIAFGTGTPFATGMFGSVILGAGTAMVYPTLLAGIGDVAHPSWRARSLSVYRFWRDMGYAIGALVAGTIADALGFRWSIQVVAALTFLSGVLVWRVLHETHPPARNRSGEGET
jgi:MFS family permease